MDGNALFDIYIYKSVHKFKKHHGTPCNVAGKCVFM